MNKRVITLPGKCRACHRCEVACIAAHNDISFKDAMKQRDKFPSAVTVIKTESIKTSVRCHQCEDAPCCAICPAGALQQRESGEIETHEELCIGCEMCVRACPYGAIKAVARTVTQSEKMIDRKKPCRCDLCREQGKDITACMEACPVQALALEREDGSLLLVPAPERKAAKNADAAAAK
ncbi:MAG: 4Fe-4S dicluster domain-containing protein [Desulfovibrio sp.]|nr:4Fe-4S dicluster domain-containing protein [Desulfovibrio sp.]